MGIIHGMEEGVLVLLCATCYGLVTSSGFLSAVVGGVTVSDDHGTSFTPGSPAVIMLLTGIFNFMLGVAGLLGLWLRNWVMLLVVELLFVLVTVFVIGGCMLAFCLAMDWRSPIAEAIRRGWTPAERKGVRYALNKEEPPWCETVPESDVGSPTTTCRDLRTTLLEAARHAGRAGRTAADICPFPPHEIMANCSLIDPASPYLSPRAENCVAGLWGGTATRTVGPTATATMATLYQQCRDCDTACQGAFIASVEDKNKTVSILSAVLFGFTVCTWMWNSFVVLEHSSWTDNDGKKHARRIHGPPAYVAYTVNGVVLFFGLMMVTVGMIDYSDAADECTKHGLDDCDPPLSVIFLLLIGTAIVATAVFALCGVWKSGAFVWTNTLRLAQIAYAVLALLLMIAGTTFALSAGTLDTLNQEYAGNWAEVRDELDSRNPEYCVYTQTGAMKGFTGERGFRSWCYDRIQCTEEERRSAGDCAWDEEMYEAVHQPEFGITYDKGTGDATVHLPACNVPACKGGSELPCPAAPKHGDSGCKSLVNMLHGTAPEHIAAAFRSAKEGSRMRRAQISCAEAVRSTFTPMRYGRMPECPYSPTNPQGHFDCRPCFPSQEFLGRGNVVECKDNDLEARITLHQKGGTCANAAAWGLCLMPVKVFQPFLNGSSAGEKQIKDMCSCACVDSNSTDSTPSLGAHGLGLHTCADTLRPDNALERADSPTLFPGNLTCDALFNDMVNSSAAAAQCEHPLRMRIEHVNAHYRNNIATGGLDPRGDRHPLFPIVFSPSSTGAPGHTPTGLDAAVKHWCRAKCNACEDVTPVLPMAAISAANITGLDLANISSSAGALDLETQCFLQVAAYVSDNKQCQLQVQREYETCVPATNCFVQNAVCRMTDNDCREMLKYDTADNMYILGIVALVIVGFLFATMFLTLLMVYDFRPEDHKIPAEVREAQAKAAAIAQGNAEAEARGAEKLRAELEAQALEETPPPPPPPPKAPKRGRRGRDRDLMDEDVSMDQNPLAQDPLAAERVDET